MKNTKPASPFEIRQPLPTDRTLTIVATEPPNYPQQGKIAFQIENTEGKLLVDTQSSLSIIATEFNIIDIVKVYETELNNNTIKFS